jgi:hypothetical protein
LQRRVANEQWKRLRFGIEHSSCSTGAMHPPSWSVPQAAAAVQQ